MPLSKATILNNTPLSGTWPEKHFGATELANVWVEFEQSNGESWYGSFAASRHSFGLTDLIFDERTNTAFISARGTGYYVNTETKELLLETEDYEPVHSIIRTHEPNFLVYSNQHNVYFLAGNKIERTISLGHVDGVYLTSLENGNLIGDLWEISADHFNIRFFIDLSNFEFRKDNKVLINRKSPTEFEPAERPTLLKFLGLKR